MRKFALSAALALALAASAAQGASADALSCGTTITSPGAYVLTSNLERGANGLQALVSGDITINLNGHSIIGPGASTATYGLDVGATGTVSIENGTVQKFGTGLIAETAIHTYQLRVSKNGAGIVEQLGGSLNLEKTAVNENLGDGIHAIVEGDIYMSDSQVNGNGGNGIADFEALLIAVRSQFSRNGGYGILNYEWGVYLQDNQANNNGLDGIYLGVNPFNDAYTLVNNTAIKNGGHGIVYDPGYVGLVEHVVVFERNVARENRTEPQCIGLYCRRS